MVNSVSVSPFNSRPEGCPRVDVAKELVSGSGYSLKYGPIMEENDISIQYIINNELFVLSELSIMPILSETLEVRS
jgi:hypothetical protein